MDERLIKIGKRIKSIKTSQQSQHDIIKEVLLELLEIIADEFKKLPVLKNANKDIKENKSE